MCVCVSCMRQHPRFSVLFVTFYRIFFFANAESQDYARYTSCVKHYSAVQYCSIGIASSRCEWIGSLLSIAAYVTSCHVTHACTHACRRHTVTYGTVVVWDCLFLFGLLVVSLWSSAGAIACAAHGGDDKNYAVTLSSIQSVYTVLYCTYRVRLLYFTVLTVLHCTILYCTVVLCCTHSVLNGAPGIKAVLVRACMPVRLLKKK